MSSTVPNRRPWAFKGYLLVAGGLALVAAAAVAAWLTAYRLQSDDVRRVLAERLELYEATLRQTIERYSYLPDVLSLDPRIAGLLQNPGDAARLAEVNALLEKIGDSSGAAVIYVMRADGLTIAASNWQDEQSFVGNNYAFRPYFSEAMQHGAGRFYGVGVTTGAPGYFISARIGPADRPLGVATVKISLALLEAEWRVANELVWLADEKGVVFLSSRRNWVYRPLAPIGPDALQQARATHQYGKADLAGHPLTVGSSPGEGAVRVEDELGAPKDYAIAQKPVAGFDWRLAVLTRFDAIERVAWQAAALAGLAVAVILLVGIVLLQRRATIRAKLRAHDELERRVEERTHELVEANARLGAEIEQRISAERHLRQTQNDLVQAGKLAALGTMSATLSHEINQPLAALRTYVSSTALLAAQGNLDAVKANIGRIDHLIGRMADITRHLKRFARVEAGPPGEAHLGSVLANALGLVAMRVSAEGVEIRREGNAEVAVRGSENRLEQVFVNLLTNALDAMRGREPRRLVIRVGGDAGAVTVEVEDSGPGIPVENRGLIFVPYFTTKEVGAGLGLGLSISHGIIQSFGGDLSAREAPAGGAIFTVQLRRPGGDAAASEGAQLEAAE